MALVLDQPLLQVEVVILLAPEHPRQRLAVHPALVFAESFRRDPPVEFVRVSDPALEDPLEALEGIFRRGGCEPQADRPAAAAGHVEDIVGRSLGPRLGGIHRFALSLDEVRVESILDVGRSAGLAPETLRIALILGEQQLRASIAVQPVLAQFMVGGLNGARRHLAEGRLAIVLTPGPGVPEPERRQQAKPGRFRPAIVHGDPDEHVFRAFLGVFHEHVEIAVVVKHARIEQLVLELLPRPSPVRLDQVAVGKLPLRILVQILHVGVRGRAVEVEIVLLHVLPMVRLAVGEPVQPLLQDGVALVPQRQGEAELLLVIADPPHPVLAPAVGP